MLEADEDNELVARLNELGLFPQDLRATFAQELIEYCVTGVDTAVVWNDRLLSILIESEKALLKERVRSELLSNPRGAIENCTQHWDPSGEYGDPHTAAQPMWELIGHLPKMFPDDPTVAKATARLKELTEEWVSTRDWDEEPDWPQDRSTVRMSTAIATDHDLPDRSVFDDLLDGRRTVT